MPTAAHPTTARLDFLGWVKPGLQTAAERLVATYEGGGELDLRQVVVVVPGQRAGRRLLELLAFTAEERDLCLTPPVVVTEGRLPEMLYTPKQPFASELVQDLAWAEALRGLPAESQQHVIPHPPAADATTRWLALGRLLRRVHVELAADRLDFRAVLACGERVPGFREQSRWTALADVQSRYHRLLEEQGLWDIQTGRLKAIELGEVHTDCDTVLLGTTDLNTMLRAMLDHVADRVTAYVVAPPELADHFDEIGCLVPGKWAAREIPLADEILSQVDGPVEQADAVTRWLATIGNRFPVDEVVVGVLDETLVPQLQRELQQSGVRGRWVEGRRISETAPFRLLAAAASVASRRRYEDLAALVRHPDVELWLDGATDEPRPERIRSLPAELDCFYLTRLPGRVPAGLVVAENPDKWPHLSAGLARIDTWLADASVGRPFRKWGNFFRQVLGDVYRDRTLRLTDEADEALHRTLSRILEVCGQLAEIPEDLDGVNVPAVDAFPTAIGSIGDEPLPPPADPGAVEILGWLELPLDDAKALIVTSFNEGLVPKSTGADPFLPDKLRQALGIMNNDRRYARDAYATTVLCHSREELRVVFARRDGAGDPLVPTRLLFACGDEALVRRSQRLFGEPDSQPARRRLLLASADPVPERSEFQPPRPVKSGRPIERLPVTHFKAYLACRYRYYLRYVRGLVTVDDDARELDGGLFGTLLHRVLSAFGRDQDGPRHSDDEEVVAAYMKDRLETAGAEMFGATNGRPAIRLQLKQAEQRLAAFASHQANLVRAGWRIVYAELEGRGNLAAPFGLNGNSVQLVGRIDRIDYHAGDRKILIIDYKTADRAQTPERTHRNGDSWIDLQLPLYRHLWPAAGLDGLAPTRIDLAYFNLPRQLDETALKLAEWDDAMLADADAVAHRVAAQICAEDFWPPTEPPPAFSEELAAICLDNVLAAPAIADGDEGVRT
jgi:ATP-dependent helicase/nuclease subunit B